MIKWFLRCIGTTKRIQQYSLSAKQDFLGLSYFLKALGGALKVLQGHKRELDDTPAISLLLSQCGIVKAVMLHGAVQSPNITEHPSVLQTKILHLQLLTTALMKALTCSFQVYYSFQITVAWLPFALESWNSMNFTHISQLPFTGAVTTRILGKMMSLVTTRTLYYSYGM